MLMDGDCFDTNKEIGKQLLIKTARLLSLERGKLESLYFFLNCLRPCFNIPYPSGPPWWTRGVRYIGPEGYDLDNYTHFESSERRTELHRAQTEEIIKRY